MFIRILLFVFGICILPPAIGQKYSNDKGKPPAITERVEAQSISSKELAVSVGGVRGFESLANPNATAKLRSTGIVGLYIHAEGWRPLDLATQKQILEIFKDTGPAVVELGFNSTPEGVFKNYYKKDFLDQGVVAETALINGLWKQNPEASHRYIDAARLYGLKRVAPVFAPNSGQFKTTSFSDSCYDNARAGALYGKALSVDAPPHVFFAFGPGYQKFVIDEILWAKANRLPVYLIISANGSKERFYEETEREIQILQKNHAMPSRLVFETYDMQHTDVANTVGNENQRFSLLGVALNIISSPVLNSWRLH